MINITINKHPIDIMECIEAMKEKEEATRCHNYFTRSACKGIDADCRKSMVTWCQQVGKALSMKPQTTWMAISFFDRYLSSGKGKSPLALEDKYKFQLSAITAFYIAVKVHETVQLSVGALARLCRGYYAEADILSMEEDILFALDWRVHTPTPMDFVVYLMQLLPNEVISSSNDSESLLKMSQKLLDRTVTDLYFTFCKPSVVGASVLSSALVKTNVLSSLQRQTFYLELARIIDLIDVMDAQSRLLKGKPISKPRTCVLQESKPCVSLESVSTITSSKSPVPPPRVLEQSPPVPARPPATSSLRSSFVCVIDASERSYEDFDFDEKLYDEYH